MKPVFYQFSEPPDRLKRARLDDIALVPASLLTQKAQNQPLANKLPKSSVLCVPGLQGQQRILTQMTRFFKSHGCLAITLLIERITKKQQKPRQRAENLKLAF